MGSSWTKIPLLFLLLGPLLCGAQDTVSVESEVQKINRRYDDFFQHRQNQEKRLERLDVGRDERKEQIRERRARLEEARKEYARQRKRADAAEEKRWEAEQKARRDHHEMLRRRHVQSRDTVEQYLLKGRKIPELKEYDLEGY